MWIEMTGLSVHKGNYRKAIGQNKLTFKIPQFPHCEVPKNVCQAVFAPRAFCLTHYLSCVSYGSLHPRFNDILHAAREM